MNGIPNGSKKRFRNTTEFIFHFVKNQKELKFHMDRVMTEPAQSTIDRCKYEWSIKGHGEIVDGQRGNKKTLHYKPDKVRPDNVFRFQTAGAARDNTIRHPAPFNEQLPSYFINLLTDEGDVVLDVFSGIGTTGMSCKDLKRQYIGMELNEKYAEFSKKRISGDIDEQHVINQYDLDNNFIRSWKTITEIENTLGFDSHNHIEDCIRKGNKTSYGFQWKLEEQKL
jgi:DNA modification methylase